MPNQPPLNPDALEAAARALVGCAFSKSPKVEELKDARWELWERDAHAAVSAYLAAVQPEVLANSKPNQNLEFAQPEVNSVALFDAWEAGATYGHNAEGRLIDKLECNPYPNPDRSEANNA